MFEHFVSLLQALKGEHFCCTTPQVGYYLDSTYIHVGEVTGYNLQGITEKRKTAQVLLLGTSWTLIQKAKEIGEKRKTAQGNHH